MLISILEKQLSLHKSLLQLAYTKQEAIKQNKADQLNQIVRDEQKHVSAVAILEKQRQTSGAGDWATWLDAMDSVSREQALTIRSELIHVMTELKQANELNMELLEQSLQLVHFQLDVITPPDAGLYGPDDEGDTPSAGPVFDSKA